MGILILAALACFLYLIYINEKKKNGVNVSEAPEKIEPPVVIIHTEPKAKKPVAKKPAAKKQEVKKPAAKKPAAKKTEPKKLTAKKPAVKKKS
jgi:hypothetical protein